MTIFQIDAISKLDSKEERIEEETEEELSTVLGWSHLMEMSLRKNFL